MNIWGKLALSIWLGNGIEFQLLPLIGWVFCLEMLINVSLSSETSALESAGMRSGSDSCHDYANQTPSSKVILWRTSHRNGGKWMRSCETVMHLHLCVCTRQTRRGGGREREWFRAVGVVDLEEKPVNDAELTSESRSQCESPCG